MRKVLLSCIGILLFGIGFSGAQNSLTQPPPDNFVVEVSPSSFQTNQPVDVRITAYRNGNVYKDYVGAVWLEIAELSPNEYVISASSNSIGWYFFSPQDLGQKLFSKGLEIKRVGQFTLRVSDYSDAAVGTTKVTVTSSQPSPSVSKIEILAPSPNSVVSQSAIAMVAYAPELKGATAQIFLNSNLLPGDHRFDASDGTLSPALSNLKEGVNTLLIRVMNISDVEIGSSDEVSFTYAPLTDNLLKRITATPSTGLRGGDTVTFELTTDDSIGSAVLLITDIQGFTQRLPMDKSADGLFTRNPAMLVTGALSIGAELTSMGLTRTYSGVLTLFVDDAPLISNVMFQLDTQTLRDLTMSWKVSRAEVTNFRVKYGLSPTELTGVEVDKPSILFTSIDPTKEYYFQIIPLLGGEKTHGTATEVYVYSPLLNTGTRLPPTPTTGTNPPIPIGPDIAKSTCVIKGIRVTTQKIGGRHYLVWDEVPGATSYTVYMSDANNPFQKRKLLDTQETQHEYPFDYSSQQNLYAYFWVEATCVDGQVMEIASATRVQVGPAEDILLLICVALLIYAGIRLYRYTE